MNKLFHTLSLTFCCILTILYLDVRNDLGSLRDELNTKAKYEDVKLRAQYVNLCLHDLEYRYDGLYSMSTTAYDMARDLYPKFHPEDEILEATIDSVRKLRTYASNTQNSLRLLEMREKDNAP